MATAGEGGAWGMAILASYMMNKDQKETLEDFLDKKVFKEVDGQEIYPDEFDVKGFEAFIERYKKGLVIEQAAVDHLIS
jgi:sugar (pentulose or hexulose) kinase